MAYKTFTAGSALPNTDIQNYLMNQSVITCLASGHPASPAQGWLIYETDNNQFLYRDAFSNWLPLQNKTFQATSTAATSTTTTTFIKDGGCGDLVFTVASTSILYRFTYIAKANSDANATTVDFRIFDGGAGSPTSGSTAIAGASQYVSQGVNQGSQLICQAISTAATGTHTIAGFYARTAGTGNVNVIQSNGQFRLLCVEALAVL